MLAKIVPDAPQNAPTASIFPDAPLEWLRAVGARVRAFGTQDRVQNQLPSHF